MRYRKLDQQGDYVFGQGQANFYIDQPEAVAQLVRTRLLLLQGEWFLDNTEGTPYATQILGYGTSGTRDQAIKQRILKTTGVTGLDAYQSSVDPATRSFVAVVGSVATQYSTKSIGFSI